MSQIDLAEWRWLSGFKGHTCGLDEASLNVALSEAFEDDVLRHIPFPGKKKPKNVLGLNWKYEWPVQRIDELVAEPAFVETLLKHL